MHLHQFNSKMMLFLIIIFSISCNSSWNTVYIANHTQLEQIVNSRIIMNIIQKHAPWSYILFCITCGQKITKEEKQIFLQKKYLAHNFDINIEENTEEILYYFRPTNVFSFPKDHFTSFTLQIHTEHSENLRSGIDFCNLELMKSYDIKTWFNRRKNYSIFEQIFLSNKIISYCRGDTNFRVSNLFNDNSFKSVLIFSVNKIILKKDDIEISIPIDCSVSYGFNISDTMFSKIDRNRLAFRVVNATFHPKFIQKI